MPSVAIDDPHKIVKSIASDGKAGDPKEVAYTNCKVIGNGSFSIAFQAKLVGGTNLKVITSRQMLQGALAYTLTAWCLLIASHSI